MTACPTCSADNAPSARFCNQCGLRLDSPAEPTARASYTPKHLAERILNNRSALKGEKKRVTVLFCDIKGSTRLAQQAGAEAWHGILDRFFGLLGSAVHRYEGTINQYTGDGVMALFGAPLALEDHAQRACFAALEMQLELRRFADELRLSKGLNLTLRVGLNSGEVIVGAIGDDLRMDYTAQGHTVNLAARMEHICEPGHVYLSRDTARLVEGYFALRSLGHMPVEGLDEPVEVFDLEGDGPLASRLDRSLARGHSPFIGRAAETAMLLAALDDVRAGRGQVLAVIGEAGIGKSRLCHEFLQHCTAEGFEVHRATGVPYASAVPLHPVRALALSRLGLTQRSEPAEVRRLIAGMLLMEHPEHAAALPAVFDFLGVGDGRASPPDQAEVTKAKLFELLATFLPCPIDTVGAARPLVLLIEDLHFLDPASEEFLQTLAAGIGAHRTLLLVNHRPHYAGTAGWRHRVLDLAALTRAELEQLASQRLGHGPGLAELAAQLSQRAGGNPFFVEEAVQALAEAGHLVGLPGHYQRLGTLADWPIPDTVQALLAARIDRLGGTDKPLLQAAAVIGAPFAEATIAALAEQAAEACAAALQRLEAAGFLSASGKPGEREFRHPLMREVAESLMLDSERARRHAQLARILETTMPAAAASAATVRIAHHWQQAGDWAKAGEWNLLTARWAASRDMRLTIAHCGLALGHLDRAEATPEVVRLRIAARAALIRMAQFATVSLDDVEHAYAEGRCLAAECEDIAGAAELIISYGNAQLQRSNAPAAVSLHAEAVALCMQHGKADTVKRFRLAILLGHFSAGLPREGIALVDRADDGAWRREPIGEDNFISRAFHALMLAWLGDLASAVHELKTAIDYAEQGAQDASWMHAFMVDLAWFGTGGESDEVLQHARRAVKLATQSGVAYFQAIAGRAEGLALCLAGQPQDAVTVLDGLRPLTMPGGPVHQFEANHLAALADALAQCGRWQAARDMASRAIESAQESGSRVWEINAWLALLGLPAEVLPLAERQQGLLRLSMLVTSSGVAGYRPRLLAAEARGAAIASAHAAAQVLNHA